MPLGLFRFFSKIRRDNREWMLFSGVNDTGDKRKKCSGIIFFIFCEELSRVYVTPKDEIFAYFSFSGVGKLIKAGLSNRQCR
jgi:hypothetical protein